MVRVVCQSNKNLLLKDLHWPCQSNKLVVELFRSQGTAASKQQLWSHKRCLQSCIGHHHGCNLNGEHCGCWRMSAQPWEWYPSICLSIHPSIHPSAFTQGRGGAWVFHSCLGAKAVSLQSQHKELPISQMCVFLGHLCLWTKNSEENQQAQHRGSLTQSLQLWGDSANH